MKYIIFGFFLFSNFIDLSAQESELFDKTWKLESMYGVVNDNTIYTYQADAPDNIADYSFLEINFTANGNYTSTLPDEEVQLGTWDLFNNADSISIDGRNLMVETLDAANLVVKMSTLEPIEENGELGLVHYYQHFKPEGAGLSTSNFLQNTIDIFPNPAKKEITIDFKDLDLSALKDLRMYNAYGQIVRYEDLQEQNSVLQLNISAFPDGLYFIEVSNKSNVKMGVKKVSIIK